VNRSVLYASTYGLIENSVAGIADFTPPPGKYPEVVIGGEPCTRPILKAVVDAWMHKTGASYTGGGFDGQYATSGQGKNYLWGSGDGKMPLKNAFPIARDGMVIIVSTDCKLDLKYPADEHLPAMSSATVRRLFGGGDPTVAVYTYDAHSGSRRFFTEKFSEKGKPMPIAPTAMIAHDDLDMVDKVACNPNAIGYCSIAFADVTRVKIVGLTDAAGNTKRLYSGTGKHRELYDESTLAAWPLARTLYVTYGGKADAIAECMFKPGATGTNALHVGLLFKASFFQP